MLDAWIIVALLFYAFACACFCSKVATEKGYGEGRWGFAGVFFGIFALIAAAGLPDRKYQHGHLPESDQPPTD